MDVMQLLQGQINGDLVNQLTREIGADSPEQTESAINGVLSTLVTALSRNTAQPDGASALLGALSQTHDGSILDDVMGFLGGQRQPDNPAILNGAGILRHILGGQQPQVQQAVGKASGLDAAQIGQLMIKLAPLVMGVLGMLQRRNGLGSDGLGQLLSGTVQQQRQQNPGTGMFEKLLDADGDGSVIDDIANFGLKALFGNKR